MSSETKESSTSTKIRSESKEETKNENDNNNKTDETTEKTTTNAPKSSSSSSEEIKTKEDENIPPSIIPPDMKSIATAKTHRKWILWFDNPRFAVEGAPWKDNLKRCGTINSAETFWRVYNNVKPITQLPLNSNYHIFKEGVEPMWEDKENINGGKFVLTVPKKESRAGKLEDWWLCTLLAIIGETMDVSGDMICGAVLSTRKAQDRIALWLKSDRKDACLEIGLKWKKAMEIEDSRKVTVKYQLHKEAAAAGHSFKNDVKFEV